MDAKHENALLSPIILSGCEICVVPLTQRLDVPLPRKAGCLVYVNHPTLYKRVPVGALMTLFGLTPTEALFCRNLILEGTIQNAALSGGITINTAKTHLKNIFQKCNVRSQAQLVQRLATSLAAFIGTGTGTQM